MSTGSSEFESALSRTDRLSPSDRQALAEIVATVTNSKKQGCIYFGVCNNRLKIKSLEEALEQALRPHGIATGRVGLAEREEGAEPPTYRLLVADPVSHLAELASAPPTLYFVHGLPELIAKQTAQDGLKPAPVSQILNYRREVFRDRAICALFWLSPESMNYLLNWARDFWSFRSGTAQFAESAEPREPADAGPSVASGWQQSAPSGRWSGDLQEKLGQLEAYRKKSLPDENAVANLLLDIGRIRVKRHELQEAFSALEEAAEIFERLRLPRKLSGAKTWLSRAYLKAGQLESAEQYVKEALQLDVDSQDEAAVATDYNDLSQIYDARGQLEEAEKWLRKAIEIDQRLGNEPNLAICYNNLSLIYKARGDLEEAEKWLRKAIEIDARLGDEPNLAIRYNNLSQIYDGRGQLEEAEKWLRKAIEIDERLSNEPKLATRYSNLSQIYKARGQLEEAEKWLRKAIEIDGRLGNEPRLAIRYNTLSQIYHARGQLEEAENWLRKAMALVESKGPSDTLNKLRANIDALLKERDPQRASNLSP